MVDDWYNDKNKTCHNIWESKDKSMRLQRKYFEEKGTTGFAARNKIIKMRENLDESFSTKINKLKEKILFWEAAEPRFTFVLECLPFEYDD